MKNIVYYSIVFGVSGYLKNIKVWLPISLILLAIGLICKCILYFIPIEMMVIRILVYILFALIGIYFFIGVTQIACGQAKNDFVQSNFSTLKTPLEILWEPMGFLVLFATMLYFGSIVILPAVVMWILFQFGLWYNLEADTQIIKSMQLSLIACKRNFITILVLDAYLLLLILTGYFLIFALTLCVPIGVLTISHFYIYGLRNHF